MGLLAFMHIDSECKKEKNDLIDTPPLPKKISKKAEEVAVLCSNNNDTIMGS